MNKWVLAVVLAALLAAAGSAAQDSGAPTEAPQFVGQPSQSPSPDLGSAPSPVPFSPSPSPEQPSGTSSPSLSPSPAPQGGDGSSSPAPKPASSPAGVVGAASISPVPAAAPQPPEAGVDAADAPATPPSDGTAGMPSPRDGPVGSPALQPAEAGGGAASMSPPAEVGVYAAAAPPPGQGGVNAADMPSPSPSPAAPPPGQGGVNAADMPSPSPSPAAPPPGQGGVNAADMPSPSPSPTAPPPGQGGVNATDMPFPSPSPAPSPSPGQASPSPSPLPSPSPAPPPDFSITDDSKPPASADAPPPASPDASPAPSPSPAPIPSPTPSSSPTPAPAPAPSPSPSDPQAAALLAFKAGLQDGSALDSWTTVASDPCQGWTGVTCDASDSVTTLQLVNLGLAGTISDSLTQLPSLQLVDLSQNQLSGTLPQPWQLGTGNAATLTSLLLHDNWLAGALPNLTLTTLANATLHLNKFTGSIPASWSKAPPAATISILPQATGSGLCGDVPDSPQLYITVQPGSSYPVANSLGSCLKYGCSSTQKNLANSNIFNIALQNNATVWDTAALNKWQGQDASSTSVTIPCYQAGSPVGGYLGGDMAYMMVAWGDGVGAAGSLVATEPGQTPICGTFSTFWTVDLRYNLTLSQVVIQAGTTVGISGVSIKLDSTPPAATSSSGSDCNTGISAVGSSTTVSCAATGRYLTLYSTQPMDLCSVAVYPEVSNAAINQPIYYTLANNTAVQTINAASQNYAVQAGSGIAPTLVLDMSSPSAMVATVTVVDGSNIQSIAISATNPLNTGSRRRLVQAVNSSAGSACTLASTSADGKTVSFQCPTMEGRYIVVTGTADTTVTLTSISAYLGQPPSSPPGPSPPPAPVASPPPPASPYQTMWVGNLLVGGNTGSFNPGEPYNAQVLDAYNTAWYAALTAAGFAMNTEASVFIALTPNVEGITGSPYFYPTASTSGNLFTNTSISVDSRLTQGDLIKYLNTSAVESSIQKSLGGSWGNFVVWMVPYTAPPVPDTGSSGLSTGAIIGIAAGGAAALLAVAALVICCLCRRKPRKSDSGLSKASDLGYTPADGDAHVQMELGALHTQFPDGTSYKASQQLEEARKAYAAQQGGAAALPYGSAYSNGAPAAAAAAAAGAAAAAAASSRSHSRNESMESSGLLMGSTAAATSSRDRDRDFSTPRTQSEDPLLALILKSHSPGTKSNVQYASHAATVAATTAAAADAADRGTPRHARGPSRGLDVRVWQFSFADLEIQKQIGEGSFGRVYLAKWRETLVAVKILLNTGVDIEDTDDAERALTLSNPVLVDLEKEASMMAALRHPNVVAFLGVCPSPPSVASEYCARGSLTDVLRGGKVSPARAKMLDWARRLNMALDAAKGMLYLHEHSPPIIHRDLKSPNLLVDKHWRVKVSDFNLSKLMEDNAVMSSIAATNPRWLAPEILSGGKANRETDVWAYGIVMWELLTWDVPWGATNPWQVVTIVGEGGRLDIPPREELPGPDTQTWVGLDAYIALLKRCWAQDATDRPLFREIISDLRDILERTLASKGMLHGGKAGASAAATPQSEGLASGGAVGIAGIASGSTTASSASAAVGTAGGGDVTASGAAAAATIPAAVALHHEGSSPKAPASGADSGSGGTPLSRHSSLTAEVGSMLEGMPRSLLDSRLPSNQASVRR